jgi:hypothetical protein
MFKRPQSTSTLHRKSGLANRKPCPKCAKVDTVLRNGLKTCSIWLLQPYVGIAMSLLCMFVTNSHAKVSHRSFSVNLSCVLVSCFTRDPTAAIFLSKKFKFNRWTEEFFLTSTSLQLQLQSESSPETSIQPCVVAECLPIQREETRGFAMMATSVRRWNTGGTMYFR